MKAIDIRNHFVDQADWVDAETTVDRIIIGDAQKDVSRVLVTWISGFPAVRRAVEEGFDALITHEPTFYDHPDHRGEEFKIEATEIGAEKKRFIAESGLVVIRNHDVWDRFPKYGIPWAWGSFLGLGDTPAEISESRYQHAYDIAPASLDEVAADFARRTAAIGEPYLQVIGAGDRTIRRVGLGTGCICSLDVSVEMGCDATIVCDDGTCYWKGLQWAADAGHAIIRANHGTSEEPGMVSMTRYINENLPGVTAEHLPHGACFRLIG